jgi:hypothetical protein
MSLAAAGSFSDEPLAPQYEINDCAMVIEIELR